MLQVETDGHLVSIASSVPHPEKFELSKNNLKLQNIRAVKPNRVVHKVDFFRKGIDHSVFDFD